MAIGDEVKSALTTAMRARDKDRTRALRQIRAALIEEQKAHGVSVERRTVARGRAHLVAIGW